MKILRNTAPISDFFNQMKSGELTINRDYQRGKGLWPDNARTYFIDTILNDFPFPKVVIQQVVNLKTKKTKREIIDGQQRLTSIRDFIENKFKLTSVSKKFKGNYFEDLDDDTQASFLSYEISIDNIVTASREEVLEIFRRINSYTLPLNTAEKRHATYQGEFKWFISDLVESIDPFLEQYNVLSVRDISRMQDADLITECCQLFLEGIQSRSAPKLDLLYRNNDVEFENKKEVAKVIKSCFAYIKDNLYEVFENCHIPSYNFYSLMGALMFNKYSIPDEKEDLNDLESINKFCLNVDASRDILIRMFTEVEEKNEAGEFPEFVKASTATTHSYKNRETRLRGIVNALQAE